MKYVVALAIAFLGSWLLAIQQPAPFTAGPRAMDFHGTRVGGLFSSNLFIPDGRQIFYSPSAIVHYVDAFFYCPPDEFIQAVLHCPEMNSMAYKKLFLKSGGGDLLPRDSS